MDLWLCSQNYAAIITMEIAFLDMTENSTPNVQQNRSNDDCSLQLQGCCAVYVP